MGGKEAGGVVIAFFGFVLLVGALKGTWQNAWDALQGKGRPAAPAAASHTTKPPPASSARLPNSGPQPQRNVPSQ